jgi:ribosomal protein L10
MGLVAPCDVTIPAGNTGLDPSQTSFFQALNVPTKINKGTVEIVSDIRVIKQGEKVGGSEATLLAKLGIRPFSYGLIVEKVMPQMPRGCAAAAAARLRRGGGDGLSDKQHKVLCTECV